MARRLGIALLTAALWGCDGTADDASAQQEAQPGPPFQRLLNDQQVMDWVLDPATDVIWGAAGSVITVEGEKSLAPTDDAGWDEVRNAAAVVSETGNLLMLPGRSRGDDWNEFAQAIGVLGERAMQAAQAHDEPALFETGGQLYNVCVACHQVYLFPEAVKGG